MSCYHRIFLGWIIPWAQQSSVIARVIPGSPFAQARAREGRREEGAGHLPGTLTLFDVVECDHCDDGRRTTNDESLGTSFQKGLGE